MLYSIHEHLRLEPAARQHPLPPLSESEVIRIVNVALSPAKMHTTTYKYAFFKAVLDNLFNVNLESHFLDYDAIALRFTEIYWNLVLNYHLKQMPASQRSQMTAVERTLFEFCQKTALTTPRSG